MVGRAILRRDFFKGGRVVIPSVLSMHLTLTFHDHNHHGAFMNMSIIQSFTSLYHMKHVFETLQRIVMFHVCCFLYKMKSVQHLSATCATHFSETWLVSYATRS